MNWSGSEASGQALLKFSIVPLVETPPGVVMAGEIASSSPRIRSFGVGPNITMDLGTDSLEYARAECELIARALGLKPVDIQQVLD